MSTAKEELQRPVDELPDNVLDAARRILEYLRDTADPLLRKLLDSPEEEKALSDAAVAGLAKAEEEFKRGLVVSHEELKREFGQ